MEKYDVIVVGAGSAGVMAALASARKGAKTLLIEESETIGGTNVRSLVGPLVPFLGETGKPIVGGIVQEVIEDLVRNGGCLGHIQDPIGFCHSLTPVDFKMMQLVLFHKIQDEKLLTLKMKESVISVEVHHQMIDSITSMDEHGNYHQYKAHSYIDASGDADLMAQAKVPFEYGRKEDGKCQPMTMVFSLGGVDLDKIRHDVEKNPDQFVISEEIQKKRMSYVAISGYFKKVQESHDFPIERDRLLFFEGLHPDEVFVNTTRILNASNLKTDEWNSAVEEGNRQVRMLYQWMKKNIEAFKDSFILDIGVLGVRESRRIVGKKQLNSEDVLFGKQQNYSIAVGSYPIDIHSPDSANMNFKNTFISHDYEIDFEMCVSNKIKNSAVAGRPISATHEAHASSRTSATCMAIGQSIGVAAALSVKENIHLVDIPYELLKKEIEQIGGIVKKENTMIKQ